MGVPAPEFPTNAYFYLLSKFSPKIDKIEKMKYDEIFLKVLKKLEIFIAFLQFCWKFLQRPGGRAPRTPETHATGKIFQTGSEVVSLKKRNQSEEKGAIDKNCIS